MFYMSELHYFRIKLLLSMIFLFHYDNYLGKKIPLKALTIFQRCHPKSFFNLLFFLPPQSPHRYREPAWKAASFPSSPCGYP